MCLGAFPSSSSFPLSSRNSAHLSSLPRIISVCLFSPHLKDSSYKQSYHLSAPPIHSPLPPKTTALAYGVSISQTKWYVLISILRYRVRLFEREGITPLTSISSDDPSLRLRTNPTGYTSTAEPQLTTPPFGLNRVAARPYRRVMMKPPTTGEAKIVDRKLLAALPLIRQHIHRPVAAEQDIPMSP